MFGALAPRHSRRARPGSMTASARRIRPSRVHPWYSRRVSAALRRSRTSPIEPRRLLNSADRLIALAPTPSANRPRVGTDLDCHRQSPLIQWYVVVRAGTVGAMADVSASRAFSRTGWLGTPIAPALNGPRRSRQATRRRALPRRCRCPADDDRPMPPSTARHCTRLFSCTRPLAPPWSSPDIDVSPRSA